jgi:hypothetical protein
VRVTLLLIVALGAVATNPATSSAATCADYSNQAAAQQAADTRDADGDGIYCESLPCPCQKPGQGGGGVGAPSPPHRQTAPTPKATPMLQRVGASRTLQPGRTKGSHCVLRGSLPDRRCTPGAVFPKATTSLICVSGYTRQVRNVPQSLKDTVLAEYRITDYSAAAYEIDHLVPLELGGSNSISNLFPEPAQPAPGFHQKDRTENAMHRQVCRNGHDLGDAQSGIAEDWTKLYADAVG